MLRDGWLCQCHECKVAGSYEIAHEVDHIDNRRGTGYDDDSNLAAINRQCHERKTQLEAKIGRGIVPRPAWLDRSNF
jgi:5-methylcytosine-specific restriction protein A